MEPERHDFDVEYYQKDTMITHDMMGFIADNFEYRMKELQARVESALESIVVEKGWLTTYSGVYAIIRPIKHQRAIALMVTYRPTLRFQAITSIDQMKDELQIMGASIRL